MILRSFKIIIINISSFFPVFMIINYVKIEHTTFSAFNVTCLTSLTENAIITVFTNLTTYGNIIVQKLTIGKQNLVFYTHFYKHH